MIMQNNQLWRVFYKRYQSRFHEKRYNHYVGQLFPNTLHHHPPPPGRPKHFRWFETSMAEEDVPAFNRFSHKVMALSSVRRCFFCKSRSHALNSFWSLNFSACISCTQDRMISDQELFFKFGFDVTSPFGCHRNFFEACKLRSLPIRFSPYTPPFFLS